MSKERHFLTWIIHCAILPKNPPLPFTGARPPSLREAHAGFLARQSAARMPTRYLCQLASAGCNDIDDRKSSRRTCITAGNVLGETCPLTTHQFFSILLSPHALHGNISHGLAPAPSPKHRSRTHAHTHTRLMMLLGRTFIVSWDLRGQLGDLRRTEGQIWWHCEAAKSSRPRSNKISVCISDISRA